MGNLNEAFVDVLGRKFILTKIENDRITLELADIADNPAPESPEFKPKDWVMCAYPGNEWRLNQIKGKTVEFNYRHYWAMHDGTSWLEVYIRPATDAEKFRPGAIVTWRSPVPLYSELTITGTIEKSLSSWISFRGIDYDLEYAFQDCTLITAAPAGETE